MNANVARHKKSVMPWMLAVCVCMGIIATVLLSNDKKHLRALFEFYELQWPFEAATKPVLAAHTGRPAAPRPVRVMLTPRLFAHTLRNGPAIFTRIMPQNGPVLCAAIGESGIAMNGATWAEAPYDRALSGCQSMTLHEGAGNSSGGGSSLFIDVKGRASGQVMLVHMKLVLDEDAGATILREKAAETFALIVRRSGWRDFAALAENIRRTEEFTASVAGMNVSMVKETSSKASYNIFVQQTGKEKTQVQVRQYFDATGTLPAAAYGRSPVCPCQRMPKLTEVSAATR